MLCCRSLTRDDDEQLRHLTDHLRKEVSGTGWQRLAKLMIVMGELGKARDVYNVLLDATANKNDRASQALIYHELGAIFDKMGDLESAFSHYEQALEIYKQYLPEDALKLANTYGNIGEILRQRGDFENALLNHRRALSIHEYAGQHQAMATDYNNIGIVLDAQEK